MVRKLRKVFRHPFRSAVLLLALAVLGILIYRFVRFQQFQAHLQLARVALLEGRLSAGITEVQNCELYDSENPTVIALSVRIFWQTQSWQKAEALLEQAWAAYGDQDELTFERLLLKAARDDTDSVAPLLIARIAAGGEQAALSRTALVHGYLRDFRFTEANQVLEGWRAEGQAEPMIDLLSGRFDELLLNTQGAIKTYSELVERHPNHHEGRLRLAKLLMQQRQAIEALGHLQILLPVLPNNPDVAVEWAVALRQLGKTEEAKAALDEALQRFPNSPTGLAERGTLYMNAGNDVRAAEDFARSVQLDPGAIGVRNLYAQTLTRLDRIAEAKEQVERVKVLMADSDRMTELIHGPLITRPQDPNPPFELAGIALRAGQPETAIRWYYVALKRSPRHAPSHTALAVIYREIGNPTLETRHRALAASGRDSR